MEKIEREGKGKKNIKRMKEENHKNRKHKPQITCTL
jgi:hypothetical protein